jgi:hypothetical protein
VDARARSLLLGLVALTGCALDLDYSGADFTTASDAGAGGGGDGGPDAGDVLAAPFFDDFDRLDSLDPGDAWLVRARGIFTLLDGHLEWRPGALSSQDMVWFATSLGSLDQWVCLEVHGLDASPGLALSVGFRGAPGGDFWALSGHNPASGDGLAERGRFESFDDDGFVAQLTDDCTTLGLGFAAGDYLCAAVSGSGAATVARIWRFEDDPGGDPSALPADCEIAQTPATDDASGGFVGFGVWSGTPDGDTFVQFDNLRGGPL